MKEKSKEFEEFASTLSWEVEHEMWLTFFKNTNDAAIDDRIIIDLINDIVVDQIWGEVTFHIFDKIHKK